MRCIVCVCDKGHFDNKIKWECRITVCNRSYDQLKNENFGNLYFSPFSLNVFCPLQSKFQFLSNCTFNLSAAIPLNLD